MRSLALALLVALAPMTLAACQGDRPTLAARADVAPTVAGRAPAGFADGTAAREAFTRQSEDGSITAVLKDAAWLRYEGAPKDVESAHPSYFRDGYTSFQVLMSVEAFTQPTRETFLLEDSAGRRVAGKPITYKSVMGTIDRRFQYEFLLAFQHGITQDTQWIRLTRQADGASLEWTFR